MAAKRSAIATLLFDPSLLALPMGSHQEKVKFLNFTFYVATAERPPTSTLDSSSTNPYQLVSLHLLILFSLTTRTEHL